MNKNMSCAFKKKVVVTAYCFSGVEGRIKMVTNRSYEIKIENTDIRGL